ncbi:MAG: acyl-ACP desaturase [Trueperaceae bacterium]
MDAFAPPLSLIEGSRPRTPAGLLSPEYKDRLIERTLLGLYRWYTSRSQETRNWNPDKSFDWRTMKRDFSPSLVQVIQGFFAVEYYAPDYVNEILQLVRRSHGRSHFQMRWGSEEEKHADTWENTLLFGRLRTPAFLEEYKYNLRSKVHRSLWEDKPLHSIIYTVFQERATQLNYLNLLKIAKGKSDKPQHADDADPVLAKVAQTIAVDEAAHYNFFLEGVRLFLYYYPQRTLEALREVLEHFTMPAAELVPDWDEFFDAVYRGGIYGPREYARDVVQIVFRNLGVASRKKLEEGLQRTRLVPTENGAAMQQTAIFDTFDYGLIEGDVKRLHQKVARYEAEIGFDEVDPMIFVPNPEVPTVQPQEGEADRQAEEETLV